MHDIKLLYQQWAQTKTGKVTRDFLWSVMSAAVVAGLIELAVSLETGSTDFQAFVAIFITGALVGAGKAISLYIGKYRS